jgi:alpha-glucosidase (family GH31 glycosyl hydrolase)
MEPGVAALEGYHIYDDLKEKGLFVRDWKGDALIGSGAAGDVVYPDFYNYQMQIEWKTYL